MAAKSTEHIKENKTRQCDCSVYLRHIIVTQLKLYSNIVFKINYKVTNTSVINVHNL